VVDQIDVKNSIVEQHFGEVTVLGEKLNNPYSLCNMQAALDGIIATKGGDPEDIEPLQPNWLYVRFLPKDSLGVATLMSYDLDLFDYPLDYELLVVGNSYHDPSIPENEPTWQYTRVRPDFDFPKGLQYEILDKCYVPEETVDTKAAVISVKDLEIEAIRRAGLENDLISEVKTKAGTTSWRPIGRVTVRNDNAKCYEAVPGVKVRCNYFLKIGTTYTSCLGYFKVDELFSVNPYYHLIFDNEKDFTIYNAWAISSVQNNYGRQDNRSYDITIESTDDEWKYAVINNAAYNYYQMCSSESISTPPSKLRFWCMSGQDMSSAPMLKHLTTLSIGLAASVLAGVVTYGGTSLLGIYGIASVPDIIIGVKDRAHKGYGSIYGTVWHELTHASHFAKAGEGIWAKYIDYIVKSQLSTGDCYGDGTSTSKGRYICELGESWAYANERIKKKTDFASTSPHGYDNWFYPTINAMEAVKTYCTGIRHRDYFKLLSSSMTNIDDFFHTLCIQHPSDSTVIKVAMATAGHLDSQTRWMIKNDRGTDLFIRIQRGFFPIIHYLKAGDTLCIAGVPSWMDTSFDALFRKGLIMPTFIEIAEFDMTHWLMLKTVFYDTTSGECIASKRRLRDMSDWIVQSDTNGIKYIFSIKATD